MKRKRVDFWLDMAKTDHNLLLETVKELKEKRLFSRAVQEGLQLWYSLNVENDTSVLYRMFPELEPRPDEDLLQQKLDELLEAVKSGDTAKIDAVRKTGFKKTGGLKSRVDVKQNASAGDDVAANLLGSLGDF